MYGIHLNGEKNGMYGKHHTEEHKQLYKEKYSGKNSSLYGRHLSEDTKRKLSESKKGKYVGENNPFYGKHHTDEVREKLSKQHLGAKSWNAIPVVQLDDSGNLIKEWACRTDAERELNICRNGIYACLVGKCKHAGGYCWAYADEYYDKLKQDKTK